MKREPVEFRHTAQIIPLYPDRYLPLKLETPPEEAYEMHSQYEGLNTIKLWAQEAQNAIFQRGEPHPKDRAETILAIQFLIEELRR